MESRVSKAVATFEEGYNCCQSVFSTYADLFGMDRETALKLSCSMGAGVGRMRCFATQIRRGKRFDQRFPISKVGSLRLPSVSLP